MNLEYAAYLLNENYILNEDAGSEGQKGARKWFEKNKVNIEFGEDQGPNAMTPIQFQQKIQNEFAKPINVALVQNDKNVNKFLMGAGRIAVTECGWLTQKEDEKMIANLKLLYAYAYFEWKDGIAAGLPGPQRGQQYGGKYNKDFNGLSYQALYNEIGADNLAEAKRRLEAARNNPEAIAAAEEEARNNKEAIAAAEEEARRNSQAGEYHIEYIPDWETSRSWYEYTNPLSTDAGCHWCITQRQSFWDNYARDPGNTTYFCWKAPSKEALLAMNRDSRWFQDWPTDRESQERAPMNEYGLSLICVQVRSDRNGNAELRCVTSRYNHRSPRNLPGPGPLYGDCLVTQGPRGLPKLCEILGITEDEFYQKFTIRSGADRRQNDHSRIPAALVQFRDARAQGNSQDTLKRILNRVCNEVTIIPNTNLVRICHGGEYNIVTGTGLLLSPARWFQTIDIDTTANNNPYIFVKFKDNGVPVCNLLTGTGKFMLAKHVKSCVASANHNYAKIGITVNGNTYFNIVNVNNGNLLLRKPAKDVLLADNYYNNIPVLFDGSDNWQLVDLKGKNLKISAPIKKALSPGDMSEGYFQGKYLIAAKLNNEKLGIVNKTTGKIIYKLKQNETIHGVGEKVFVIKNKAREYYLYDNQGNLLLTNSRNAIHISPYPSKYVTYKSSSDGLHVYNIETRRDVRISDEMRSLDSSNSSYKNMILLGGNYIMIDDEILPGRLSVPRIVRFNAAPFTKYAAVFYPAGTRFINLEAKEAVIPDIKTRGDIKAYNNYLYFRTQHNKLKVYNENFEIITEVPQVEWVTPINYDCSLVKFITGDNAKYNIINSDGEMMFEHNFTDMLTTGFDENGVASIKAGRYEYFINTDGDVSRSLGFVAEKMQMKTDGPILMEYTSPLRKEF